MWSSGLLHPMCYWPLAFVILKLDKYCFHNKIINHYNYLYTAHSIVTTEITTVLVSSCLTPLLSVPVVYLTTLSVIQTTWR